LKSQDVLNSKNISINGFADLLLAISTKAIFIEVLTRVDLAPYPKDNFLLALAKDGNVL